VFIMQVLPLTVPSKLKKLRRSKGLPLVPYMPEAFDIRAESMKNRMIEVAKRCSKCVVFDITKRFHNEAGNFTVIHPTSKLWYFDSALHLTPIGLNAISPMLSEM
ncbi:hypothetical protein PMAYCL1PPCAC_33012, partial [Pristionchus mayeri]